MDQLLADALDEIVSVAYMDGIALQSNYARTNATSVACAASMGLISTENADGSYGRTWRPTHMGYLWAKAGQLSV